MRITTGNALPHRGSNPAIARTSPPSPRHRALWFRAKKTPGTRRRRTAKPSPTRFALPLFQPPRRPEVGDVRRERPAVRAVPHTTSVVRPVSGAVITSSTLQCRSYWSVRFFPDPCVMELMGTVERIVERGVAERPFTDELAQALDVGAVGDVERVLERRSGTAPPVDVHRARSTNRGKRQK